MKLNELHDNIGSRVKRMRVGRGIGSGKGKTGGRGGKGQTARTGVAINGFEGGQTPLHRRLPKRGFNNPFKPTYALINLGQLQKAIDAGSIKAGASLDAEALIKAGLIRRELDGVRLLAKGELKSKLSFKIAGASKAAIEAIEKLGGKVELPAVKAEAA